MNAPTRPTLDALNALLSTMLPLRARHGALSLASTDFAERGTPVTPVGALLIHEWGIAVNLQCIRAGRPPADGEVLLARSSDWDDVRLLAFVEGWLAALKVVLESADAKSIDPWVPHYLTPSMPIDKLDEGSSAAEYRAEFLKYPWLGSLLPKRPASAPPFERAPRSAVLRGDAIELQALWDWIGRFARRTYVDRRWDDAMIAALPAPVRALDGAQMIYALVGGNGFETFLGSQRSSVIVQCYESLVAIGARATSAAMARGIGLAAKQGAEFLAERSVAWTRTFRGEAAAQWSEVDGHDPNKSYALMDAELSPCALAFAERHRDVLVRAAPGSGSSSDSPG